MVVNSSIPQILIQHLEQWGVTYHFDGRDYIQTPNLSIRIMSPQVVPFENSSCFELRIWEDVFLQKPLLVLARLASLFGNTQRIHARKTKVLAITQTEANVFLEQSHLLGTATSKYKLGLFENQELVAVALFSRFLKFRELADYHSVELVRFANKTGFTVVGGMDKLIQYFVRNYQPDDIMTYVDAEWSQGESFQKLGFVREKTTPPKDFWVHPITHQRLVQNPDNKEFMNIKNSGNIKFRLHIER